MIRTAVDSSVLLDVFSADPVYGEVSLKVLQKCWREGVLIACDIVWAEIRPRFDSDEALLKVTEKIGLCFEPLEQRSALKARIVFSRGIAVFIESIFNTSASWNLPGNFELSFP
ncbi:MAG: hypothetical protein HY073_00975 [Deltaproteobacteria bacterium]|nr:hypothetical protein [Deltaproteobacteria bacterium]